MFDSAVQKKKKKKKCAVLGVNATSIPPGGDLSFQGQYDLLCTSTADTTNFVV